MMKYKDALITMGVAFILLILGFRYYFSHSTFVLSECIESVKTSGIVFAIVWIILISTLYDKILPMSDNL